MISGNHRRLIFRTRARSDYLMEPPEPLALRLSSNLMVGVTRVYKQQYQFYFNDVNHVFVHLKQHLLSVGAGGQGGDAAVEMEQPVQRCAYLYILKDICS